MKTLYDLFSTKKSAITKHFFLFANRPRNDEIDKELWNNSQFLSESSICVLFNNAMPLAYYDIVKAHKNKWVVFRLLSKDKRDGVYFRNLDILSSYKFSKIFFIPDFLDPIYKNKPYYIHETTEYLLKKNINLENIMHFSSFKYNDIDRVLSNYPINTKNNSSMTSGFWTYLLLRNQYPDALFTLVDFELNITSEFHFSDFEKGYILNDIISGKCNYIGNGIK